MQFWRYLSFLPSLAPASQFQSPVSPEGLVFTASFLFTTCWMCAARAWITHLRFSSKEWDLGGSCAKGVFTLRTSLWNGVFCCGNHSEVLFGFFLKKHVICIVPWRWEIPWVQIAENSRRVSFTSEAVYSSTPALKPLSWGTLVFHR